MAADRKAVERTMNALLASTRSKRQDVALSADGGNDVKPPADFRAAARSKHLVPNDILELVHDIKPRRRLSDLVLAPALREQLDELIDEQANTGLLRSNSLEPRHTILLVGPPGNGKTSLAEAIATELGRLFLTVRYEALIGSYLGETATRLRKVIDYADRTPCVLFFDEFDAVGKERGDAQETGEMKRVVSSLLVQMESLPASSIVVCATNHPEMLDRAMWRRFELKLLVEPPGPAELRVFYARLAEFVGDQKFISEAEYIEMMKGENYSELEAFALDVRRKLVLGKGELAPWEAVSAVIQRRRMDARLRELGNNAVKTSADRSASRKRRTRQNSE